MTFLSPSYFHYSGINKHWKKKAVLQQVDIKLYGGECVLISGENGSGKSTLLRILAGLLKPDRGFTLTGSYYHEHPTWKRNSKLLLQHTMYLHQTPYLFAGTVEKNLSYVQAATKSPQAIQQAMKWADISHLAQQSTSVLSGGERQRVALARAWLKHPKVLFLDEPTANLDQQSRQRMLELICCLKKQNVSIVIASHDPLHFASAIDVRLSLHKGILSSEQYSESKQDNIVASTIIKRTTTSSEVYA